MVLQIQWLLLQIQKKIGEYIRDFAENDKLIIYEVPNIDTEIIDAKMQVMYSVEDIFDYFYLHR